MTANTANVDMESNMVNPKARALKEKERHDYNAVAKYYDANTSPLTDVFGLRTVELLDPQPGDKVLEVTCGSGTMIPELARRVGPNGMVTGFDQSDGMLQLARKKAEEHGLTQVNFYQGDAEALPNVPTATYDRAMSVFGFMYFPNPVTALKKVKAALKPGGRVVITVWGMPETVPGLTLPMEGGARVLFPPPISWFMSTGLGRKMLYKQLLKDKLGGGKSPMSLAPAGLLEGYMAEAGFTHLKREEPSNVFIYKDFDEYWDVLMGTPARVLIQKYSDAKVAKTKAMITQLLHERHRMKDGRFGVPMTAVIVAGNA
jgi:ubiquinone/menaquinone biosynthesis C-methylase UbiE